MVKTLVQKTSEFLAGDGIWIPVKRFTVNERINHRQEYPQYHILNFIPREVDNSAAARRDRYEVRCLEKGVRPFGYPDHLWEEYLRDCESEEHTNKCDARNAWRYIN